ncbi:MAG: propanediol/glycerol family dehydratase medium subunit [Peptostreptococcaceae bacterium]|nr:propanediol/glycerol family dehydratase medium subunit [Peptostreptococcaceae bacterium]
MTEFNESEIKVEELGEAQAGKSADEVIIAVSPAFGTKIKKSIIDVGLEKIIKEICAGIEEEGLKYRFIKVKNSTDLAIIASQGSKLSGSGICVGIQSRGTTVIHQRDLVALDNLELFPQSPLYDAKIYRKIGKNAGKYAKGENPEPVEILNDFMIPSKYLIKSTLMHLKETEVMEKSAKTVELKMQF